MTFPTLDGSVVGFRSWKFDGPSLVGPVFHTTWHPGINEAKCELLHEAPALGCKCGIYAYARKTGLTGLSLAPVRGAIEAWADEHPTGWDRFFLHSTGFRAQYGRIVLLTVSDNHPRVTRKQIYGIAKEFGVATCKWEHLEDAAQEYGQLVPDHLLKWAEGDDAAYWPMPTRWAPPSWPPWSF